MSTVILTDKFCAECKTEQNLSRHHLKDQGGIKTGEIDILCRPCHDQAEIEYFRLGIVKDTITKATRQEELQLQYMAGLLPYYTINPRL